VNSTARLFVVVILCGTFVHASDEKEPRHVEISELSPDLDGATVVMSFKVANTYWISGLVPKGQPRSFGITPVVEPSDPRFSVLVSGDLADVMERFGYAPPRPGDPAAGLMIRARGKIRVYPAPKAEPESGPSYQLQICDWKGFRVTSPLPRSDGKTKR
jgi:hypothetical protein